MKKPVILFAITWALLLVAAWFLGGRSGFGYGLVCTKCLKEYTVNEKRFLGVPYSTSKALLEDPSSYADFTGLGLERESETNQRAEDPIVFAGGNHEDDRHERRVERGSLGCREWHGCGP